MADRITPEQKKILLEYVEYGTGKNQGRWTCNKCGYAAVGRPYRIKAHLLRIQDKGADPCPSMENNPEREILATRLGLLTSQPEQPVIPINETHDPGALVEDNNGGVEETDAGGSQMSKTIHREHSSQPDSTLPSFPANLFDDQNPPSPQDLSFSDLVNDSNFPSFENIPFPDIMNCPFEDFSDLVNDHDICPLQDGALEDPSRSVNSMDTEGGLQQQPREENHSLNYLRDLENTSSRSENREHHPNVSDLSIAVREEGASPDVRIRMQKTVSQGEGNKKRKFASGSGTIGRDPTEAEMSQVGAFYSFRAPSPENAIGSEMAFSSLVADEPPPPDVAVSNIDLSFSSTAGQILIQLSSSINRDFKRLLLDLRKFNDSRARDNNSNAPDNSITSPSVSIYDKQNVGAFDHYCLRLLSRLLTGVRLVEEIARKLRRTSKEGVEMLGTKRNNEMERWLAWAACFKINVYDLDLNFEKAKLPEEILLLLEAKPPEEIPSLWKRIKELTKVGDILIDTGTSLLNVIVPKDLLSWNPNPLSCTPQLQNRTNPGRFPQEQQGEEIDSLNNLGDIGYTSSRAENRENYPNVSDLGTVGLEEGASPDMRMGMQNTVSQEEGNKKRKFASGSGTSGSVSAEEEVPPVGALNSSSALRPENATGGEMATSFVDIESLLTRVHRVKEMVKKIRRARKGGVEMLGTKRYNEMERWLAYAANFKINVKDLDLNFEKAKSPEEILPLLEAKTPEEILLLLKHFKELIEVADKLIETGTKISNPIVRKDLLSWNLNSRSCGSQWQDQMNSAQIPQQV